MTENYGPADPYRYGAPEPVPTAQPTGRQLTAASWQLLKQDRELLWLPVISAVTGLLAAAVLFIPGFAIGRELTHQNHTAAYVGGVLAAFALSVVSIYFQAALVIGANIRAEGGDPDLGEVLARAWTLKRQILGWAVLTTTVGAVIRAVEERLGIFGKLLGFLGGIAWALASFLVVPVLVAERLGPIDAVKRSAALIRHTWGSSVRTTLRLGFAFLVLYLPIVVVFVIAIALLGSGSTAAGIVVLAVAILAVLALSSVYAAITTYARAMIYRFAVGLPVPGIPTDLFNGAFKAKRGRGRRR